MDSSDLVIAVEFMVNKSVEWGAYLYPLLMGIGLFVSLLRSV